MRQSFHRMDSAGKSPAVEYVIQDMPSYISAIRRWVVDPSQELTVNLAQINLIRFAVWGPPFNGVPDLVSSFRGDRGNVIKAREHLRLCAWQQEIADINARLNKGTYFRGGHGDKERQELPLPESKKSRMNEKRTRLEELVRRESSVSTSQQ